MSSNSKSTSFWNREYRQGARYSSKGPRGRGSHLALSDEASEDLFKFLRWLERRGQDGEAMFSVPGPETFVLDMGCGNGRNLIYLAKKYGVRGVGYDTSREALDQAAALSRREGIPDGQLVWHRHDMGELIPCPDQSVHLVLDMMASHVLSEAGRTELRGELARVMAPGAWLFFKTFLKDGDAHAERMLRHTPDPSGEKNTYIHPRIGVAEHVWTEEEIKAFYTRDLGFRVEKLEKSHKHIMNGKAFKRRYVVAYVERDWK